MKEPIQESGVWKCPYCDFSAYNRKAVEMHISRAHRNEKKEREKKDEKDAAHRSSNQKKKKEGFHSPEFLRFRDGDVTVVLRNGIIIKGTLTGETAYNIILKNAEIRGSKHIAFVEDLLISKSSLVMLHTKPAKLEEVSD